MTGIHQALTGSGTGPISFKVKDIITYATGLSNIALIVDAGDSASYGGSGQTWTDVSGAGHNITLGTSTGADAFDPTFNGAAGSLGEVNYWSGLTAAQTGFFDASIPTYTQTWQKSGGTCSVICIFSPGAAGKTTLFLTSVPAWSLNYSATNQLDLNYAIDNVPTVEGKSTTATASIATTHFFGCSFTAGGSIILQIDGTQETFTASATSVTNNTTNVELLNANKASAMKTGDKYFAAAAWSRALSSSELNSLYANLKGRFTSIP